MQKVLLAGAGGHCKATLDVLFQDKRYTPFGLINNDSCCEVLGVPVVGSDADLEQFYSQGIKYAFVAIGNNQIRQRLHRRMEQIGFKLITLISCHAIVSCHTRIGKGCLVMPGAVVNAGAQIGEGCILNTNCSVDHDCLLGDFVHIAPGCALSGSVQVGTGSFLGTGARVIDGIKLGSWLMLGAGAVAIDNLPSHCTAVGVPAKVIKNSNI